MMWPWRQHKRAVAQVHEEVADAVAERLAAQQRQEAARRQKERSQEVSARLRQQISLNGFTELLQEAWGRR